ncbi:hypothetical protein CPB83DRAFT_861954 [Crepidotus variabilis]|uniref:Uncharacterized protein n=1 Tax=Crepidotus variabilis TaxID=179855 RepID=A0A9P6JK93_9AGAR|nr:hypothetical protein CPB83DRAFT_861954 [Crepidotus variabilis]
MLRCIAVMRTLFSPPSSLLLHCRLPSRRSNMRWITHLFFALLCLLNVVEARPQKPVTNAARLQAGLPILKPRNLYAPSRVEARDPNPSNLPPSLPGIEVRDASGNKMGYVERFSNDFEFYGLTTSTDPNVRMGIVAPVGSGSEITISTGSSYPFLGFSLAGNNKLSDGFFAYCSSTAHTSPGAPPTMVGSSGGSGSYSESSIWTLSGGQLIPSWIEPSGSPVPVAIYLNTGANSFLITDSQFDTGFPRVTFYLA